MDVVGHSGKDPQGKHTLDMVRQGPRLQRGRWGGQVSSRRYWGGGRRSRLDLGLKNLNLLCVSKSSFFDVFGKNLLTAFNGVGRRRAVYAGEEDWGDEEFVFRLPGFPEELWFCLILLVGVLNLYCFSIGDH